jgi:Fic family protein
MNNYAPPFTFTSTMVDYISSIMEKIGKLDNYTNFNKIPSLRRNNRIKSIHSSLAIEANSLSLDQVKDVIAGKTVIGPQKEIQEVKNAYNAYEMINDVNPYSINDLKKIHGVMTYLIVDESGEFRKGNEGVFDGDKCIHICPPPEQVCGLMEQLFGWMKKAKNNLHPLILASVFHYEFVFIHPFKDGNGRTARLWHNIILSEWKEIFEYLPIESQLKKYQDGYYKAIADCNLKGDSTAFIEFMLKMIDEVLDEAISTSRMPITETGININKLLDVMEYNKPMTANEIMYKLGIKSKETLRYTYLDPAIKEGVVALTIPDKPTSKNQMYYKV